MAESRIDYVGFGLLAVGVGFLQIVLDKGQEDDWFGSNFIVTLSVISIICLIVLVAWELRTKDPILDIRLFKNFNFATSSVMMFMVGAASFSTTVLMPQFLQTLLGYTAQKAGMVLSAAAILLLIELPFVGQLTARFQARYLMAFGWGVLTIAMFFSTRRIDLGISFAAATWLRIAQYVPMGFIFIPATMVAYLGIPQEKSNAVAGLINFVRNMGSSVGTSVVTTILARRAQVHQMMLASHTHRSEPGLSKQDDRDDADPDSFGRGRKPGSATSLWANLPIHAFAGVDDGIHRYVLAARHRHRDHVRAVIFVAQEQPEEIQRDRSARALMNKYRIALANIQFPATPEESVTLAEQAIAQASESAPTSSAFRNASFPATGPRGRRYRHPIGHSSNARGPRLQRRLRRQM